MGGGIVKEGRGGLLKQKALRRAGKGSKGQAKPEKRNLEEKEGQKKERARKAGN